MKKRVKIILVFLLILAILVAIFIFLKPFIILDAGEAGVVFNKINGMQKRILNPGFNYVIPLLEKVYIYKTQVQSYTAEGDEIQKNVNQEKSIESYTVDGQKIKIDISIIYRIDKDNLWKLHSEVGPNFLEKIIVPFLRTEVRNVISQYSAVNIYSSSVESSEGRTEIQEKIKEKLKESLSKYYIITEDILLRKISFSENFIEAMEKKQIEVQKAEALLISTEAQKKATIINAQAESEAMKIVGETITLYPELINYLYVQKLSPNVQTIVTSQPTILNLPNYSK